MWLWLHTQTYTRTHTDPLYSSTPSEVMEQALDEYIPYEIHLIIISLLTGVVLSILVLEWHGHEGTYCTIMCNEGQVPRPHGSFSYRRHTGVGMCLSKCLDQGSSTSSLRAEEGEPLSTRIRDPRPESCWDVLGLHDPSCRLGADQRDIYLECI